MIEQQTHQPPAQPHADPSEPRAVRRRRGSPVPRGFAGWVIIAGLMLALGASLLRHRADTGPIHDGIGWRTDVREATAAAAASGRPILLDFTAEWCLPCRQMSRDVFSDGRVKELVESRFVPARVDLTRSGSPYEYLMDSMQVDGIPTLIVLAPDGTEVARSPGAAEAEDFAGWLNTALRVVEARRGTPRS